MRSNSQYWFLVTLDDISGSRNALADIDSNCRQHMEEQFQKYINRFGSGMVIYWHGFIDDLQDLDENLVLADHFPSVEEITQLPMMTLLPKLQ